MELKTQFRSYKEQKQDAHTILRNLIKGEKCVNERQKKYTHKKVKQS